MGCSDEKVLCRTKKKPKNKTEMKETETQKAIADEAEWWINYSGIFQLSENEIKIATDSFIAGRSKSLEAERKTAIGFAHWKDRHFKRTYPWTGYFYCLEHYESIKLITGVKYGEHYSFEQLYDLYIVSQK